VIIVGSWWWANFLANMGIWAIMVGLNKLIAHQKGTRCLKIESDSEAAQHWV